jgi:hypothetical protein
MVARLFRPWALLLRGGMRLRNCGRHWYLLQLLDEPFCPPAPGRRFRLPHSEHGVFDVRRERDANTDLCRYVSYGSSLCENSDVELARRNFVSISSMRKPIALATSVGRRRLRKQFCASLARSRFHTASVNFGSRTAVRITAFWPTRLPQRVKSDSLTMSALRPLFLR